jgi:hypothetical protein
MPLIFWYLVLGIVVFAVTVSKMPLRIAIYMTLLVPAAFLAGAFAAAAGQIFLYSSLSFKPSAWLFWPITLTCGLFGGYYGSRLVRLLTRPRAT